MTDRTNDRGSTEQAPQLVVLRYRLSRLVAMADVAVPGLLLCVRRELPYFPTYSHRRARPPARTKATASVSASASAASASPPGGRAMEVNL